MELDVRTQIALLGIAVSAALAAAGLILNFFAIRRNNRIAVSTKLMELSKLLSDELVARVRSHQMYARELAEAKKHPESDRRTAKIVTLEGLLEKNLERQHQLDEQTKALEVSFKNLSKVDPAKIDAAIAQSYRLQALAESGLDLAQRLKAG